MDTNVLSVRQRHQVGKNYARKLRRNGLVPAVAYAGGKPSIIFELNPAILLKMLQRAGKNTLLKLQFEDQTHPEEVAMIREIQREPISRSILHVDFSLVDLTKPIQVHIKLSYEGRPVGTLFGGIAEVVRREVMLECLPNAIPIEIKVDITNLGLNQALHVSDLVLPENVKVLDDPQYTLITITSTVEDSTPESEESK
jgi:large subunit ribosomal protein L25